MQDNELLQILYKGIENGEKYSAKVRHFCFGLHYHSPRAYEHIRRVFNNHLPHERTIRRWYQNSDVRSEPGIHEETIQKLKKIADEFRNTHGSQLICSLIFDEMALRKQIHWSIDKMDYVGQVENSNEEDERKHLAATEAIVFLLNGLNANFEFPVAYNIFVSLNALQKKEMLEKIIKVVSTCGIKISNLTFDGLATNISMCSQLGANLDVMSHDFQPFFKNPINNENIYVVLDPCHMAKVVRNTLASKGELFDDQNNKIEWRYIELLREFSEKNNFLAHKLNKKHIQWKRNEMNVAIAVQTLSGSVADSLDFLMKQKIAEFKDVSATTKFIRNMNNLFDIFNSKHSKSSNIFKCALSANNKRIIFDFFGNMIEYFKTLQINVETFVKNKRHPELAATKVTKLLVLKSRNKTAFRGFIINMQVLMHMYREYVEENCFIEVIPTYYMLQDALELFFGRIRSCGGFNNNPNVYQFKGAYKKLQANMKLISSERGNCRVFDAELPSHSNFSNIYYVSSKRAVISPELFEENYDAQKDAILQDVASLVQARASDYLMDTTSNFSIAHLALLIERKILHCPRFYCNSCKTVLIENEKLSIHNTNTNKSMPCTSTFDICKKADQFFELYDIRRKNSQYDFRVIYCLIFRSMNFESLYRVSKFDCDPGHKYQFIKCIVGTYITLKATYVSKEFTFQQYRKIFRQQLNRLVLRCGQ